MRLYRCEMEKFIQTTKLKLSNCNWLAANVNTYLIKDNQEAIVFWLALYSTSGSHEYWWGLRRHDVLVWTMALPLAPDNTPGSPWKIGERGPAMLVQGRVTVATERYLCICQNHIAPVDDTCDHIGICAYTQKSYSIRKKIIASPSTASDSQTFLICNFTKKK